MIASNWNLAETEQSRPGVALALSLAVHLAILFAVSLKPPSQSGELRTTALKISIEYSAPPAAEIVQPEHEHLGVREGVDVSQAQERVDSRESAFRQSRGDLKETLDQVSESEHAFIEDSAPLRKKLLVDELRGAWRDGEANQGEAAPLRLTDEIKLDAEERAYLAAWQRKVQRIGRLNFPTDDQGNRLRGSLRLLVGIEADGSLAYAEVTESSGDRRVDAAAIDIARLAAPYAPIPPTLRRGNAVLEIERTWRIGAHPFEM